MDTYEKKYNEALEKARMYRDNAKAVEEYAAVARYENIFPQLRESEDERIRKKLYNTVLGTPNDSTWFDGTSKEAMLAWLEKQKEPHYTKRNALFDKCVENCDPDVMKEVSDKVDEMLGKEQKPSCWNSPIMTHEMIMEQQKPAEWSEEDEKNWRLVLNEIKDCELRCWFYSVWERLTYHKPRWKPNEEQMAGLLVAIGDEKERGSDVAKTLRSLYEQLKKL